MRGQVSAYACHQLAFGETTVNDLKFIGARMGTYFPHGSRILVKTVPSQALFQYNLSLFLCLYRIALDVVARHGDDLLLLCLRFGTPLCATVRHCQSVGQRGKCSQSRRPQEPAGGWRCAGSTGRRTHQLTQPPAGAFAKTGNDAHRRSTRARGMSRTTYAISAVVIAAVATVTSIILDRGAVADRGCCARRDRRLVALERFHPDWK
jgi:hypothetical protein